MELLINVQCMPYFRNLLKFYYKLSSLYTQASILRTNIFKHKKLKYFTKHAWGYILDFVFRISMEKCRPKTLQHVDNDEKVSQKGPGCVLANLNEAFSYDMQLYSTTNVFTKHNILANSSNGTPCKILSTLMCL